MNPRRLHRRDRPTGSRPTDVVDASMLARLDAEGFDETVARWGASASSLGGRGDAV